jgi:hypothetical protein
MAHGRCWLLLLSVGISLHGASPIRDEGLRRQILAVVFPNMPVSAVSGDLHPSNKPKPGELIFLPDALAGERVYRVIGPPSGKTEYCAAEDMGSETFKQSEVRKLSFVAYRWPRRSDLLAVLQYKFIGANPAGSCWSIGRIVHLAASGDGRWRIVEDLQLDIQHHSGLERIELIDLSGSGTGELLVESDWGGAATAGSSLHVYSLESGRFVQWLDTTARVEGMYGSFTQLLNIPKTRAKNARSFCFRKTEYAEADYKLLPKPQVSIVCYPRYEGVERR